MKRMLLITAFGVFFFALSLVPKAHAAISLVQATTTITTFYGSTGSTTLSFGSNLTVGNFLIIDISEQASNSTGTISDTLGNSFILETSTNCLSSNNGCNFTAMSNIIYYVTSTKGGADTIKWAWTTATNRVQFAVFEYSGISATNPIDTLNSATNGASQVTSQNTGSSTTSNANDLLFSSLLAYRSSTSTPNTTVSPGWTKETNSFDGTTGDAYLFTSDQIVSSIGTYSNTIGGFASSEAIADIVAFQAETTAATAQGYAWGDKAGWVNFGTQFGNFQVTASTVTMYAWSQNFGWINFAPSGSGVTNDGLGNLQGYAWSAAGGWVNFLGVSISSTGTFVGIASGTMAGNINFNCSTCLVTAGWQPPGNPVTVSTPLVDGGSSTIILTPGATTTVVITASTTDAGGAGLITYATSTLYRTSLGQSCTANNQNCYQITSSSCSFSGSTSTVTCTANVWYFADSTGDPSSSYPGDSWTAAVTVGDSNANSATGVSSPVDVGVLNAVNVATSSINYGTLGFGGNSGTTNQTTSVQNAGNSSTSLQVWGTDLVSGVTGISFIQSASSSKYVFTSSTSQNATFASNTVSSDTIVVVEQYGDNVNGTSTPTGCSDTRGDAYAKALVSEDFPGTQGIAIYYALDVTGGSTSTVVTCTMNNSNFLSMAITEYRGIALTSALDSTSTFVHSDTTTFVDVLQSGTTTPTTDGDLLIGGLIDVDGGLGEFCTAQTPFTARVNQCGATGMVAEDYIQPAAQPIEAFVDISVPTTTNGTAAGIAGFKPAVTGKSIVVSSEHYATSSFTFGGSEQMLSSSSAAVSGFLLTDPTSTNPVSSLLYWGITVPSSTATGTYNGINNFISVFHQ